jgi:hypothetical protein
MTVPALSLESTTSRYRIRQAIRSEAVKITTLRSSWWTLLITVAGMATVTVIATNNAVQHPSQWNRFFDPTNQSLTGILVGTLTMGVFGILVVTGEYATGTIRTSLSAMPRRPLFLAGKAVVGGGVMLAVGEALTFGCFFLGQAVLSGGGAPHAHLGQPGVARAVILSGVFLALLGMMGMGFGLIIRSTAGAISAYVGVAYLLPLLLKQLSGDPQRYAPIQILGNSVAVTVKNPGQVEPVLGLLLMVAYAASVLALGAVVFATRDA